MNNMVTYFQAFDRFHIRMYRLAWITDVSRYGGLRNGVSYRTGFVMRRNEYGFRSHEDCLAIFQAFSRA